MDMRDFPQNNSFWNWSVKVYESCATKNACLRLQDIFGLDVNTLLWLCWLASEGKAPTSKALDRSADISQCWNIELTRNVRNARKSLRGLVSDVDTAQSLKTELLKLELLFERRQQGELEQIAVMAETEGTVVSKLCQNNLDLYLASREISSGKCAKLTEELCAAIFATNLLGNKADLG